MIDKCLVCGSATLDIQEKRLVEVIIKDGSTIERYAKRANVAVCQDCGYVMQFEILN